MASMEIIRTERRRRYSDAEKAALLAEVDAGGCTIAQVARRHGMAESLLYNWRANRRCQVPPTPSLNGATTVSAQLGA